VHSGVEIGPLGIRCAHTVGIGIALDPCLAGADAFGRAVALLGLSASAFETRVKERPGFLMVPNCLGVVGGVPILFEGECLGGVGVSGIDHDDERIAQAGVDAFQGGNTLA